MQIYPFADQKKNEKPTAQHAIFLSGPELFPTSMHNQIQCPRQHIKLSHHGEYIKTSRFFSLASATMGTTRQKRDVPVKKLMHVKRYRRGGFCCVRWKNGTVAAKSIVNNRMWGWGKVYNVIFEQRLNFIII